MNGLRIAVRDGVVVVGPDQPDGAPDSPVPPVTLAVSGGLLAWPWCLDSAGGLDPRATLTRPPVAVLEDVTAAQEWLWALYGRDTALAVLDATGATSVGGAPGLGWLPAAAARFAFGTWLSAWWPASTTDGIAALDPALLRAELEPLGARLDLLVDGAEPPLPAVVAHWRPAPDRYALAAGAPDDGPTAVGVSVSTGVGGTCWSDLPAGWVDASDLAVSWRLRQDLDHWSFRVRAAAGPVVVVEQARLVAEAAGRHVELRPGADLFGRCWSGESTGTDPGPVPEQVRVYLPGFAPDDRADGRPTPLPTPALEVLAVDQAGPDERPAVRSAGSSASWQELVRGLARRRLAAAAPPGTHPPGTHPAGADPAVADPWQAEQAAAADDDDY